MEFIVDIKVKAMGIKMSENKTIIEQSGQYFSGLAALLVIDYFTYNAQVMGKARSTIQPLMVMT